MSWGAALAPCPVDGHSGRGDSAAVDSCGLGVLWARRGAPSPAAVRAPGAHAPTALGCPPTAGRGRSGRAACPRFSRSERAWPLASRGPCVWRGLSCRPVLCSVLPSSQRSCVLTPVPPRGFSGGPRSASDRCLCVAAQAPGALGPSQVLGGPCTSCLLVIAFAALLKVRRWSASCACASAAAPTPWAPTPGPRRPGPRPCSPARRLQVRPRQPTSALLVLLPSGAGPEAIRPPQECPPAGPPQPVTSSRLFADPGF